MSAKNQVEIIIWYAIRMTDNRVMTKMIKKRVNENFFFATEFPVPDTISVKYNLSYEDMQCSCQ